MRHPPPARRSPNRQFEALGLRGFTVFTFRMHRSGRKSTFLAMNFKLTLFTVFIDVCDKDLIS